MTLVDEAVQRLKDLARELQQDGQAERAARLSASISVILSQPSDEPETVLTTGEAAAALGVRSVNTIKRWANDGLLEGYWRGGRMLVSRRSVDALKSKKVVTNRVAVEQRIKDAFAPFSDGDDAIESHDIRMAWEGQKPWEQSERDVRPSADSSVRSPTEAPDCRH